MRVFPPLLSALVLVACGSPQRVEHQDKPRGYRERLAEAEQHERDAAVHARQAAEARGSIAPGDVPCGHPVVSQVGDHSTSGGERLSTWAPCWSVARDAATFHEAEADRLRKEARADRAVARNLLAVEGEFCQGLPPDELTHTPFSHREDIAAVEPYVENGAVRGARIHFKAVRGLDAEWMRHALQCHRARAAMIGYDPMYMAYDPTMLDGVNVAVTESRGTVHVLVRSNAAETSAVVHARALALVQPPAPE